VFGVLIFTIGLVMILAGFIPIGESFEAWFEKSDAFPPLLDPIRRALPTLAVFLFALTATLIGKADVGHYALVGSALTHITVFVALWSVLWKDASGEIPPRYRSPNQPILSSKLIKNLLGFRTISLVVAVTAYSIVSLNLTIGRLESVVLLSLGFFWLTWMASQERRESVPSVVPLFDSHSKEPPEAGEDWESTRMHRFFSEKLGPIGIAPFAGIGLLLILFGSVLVILGLEQFAERNAHIYNLAGTLILGFSLSTAPLLLQLAMYRKFGPNLGVILDQIVFLLLIYPGICSLLRTPLLSSDLTMWDLPTLLMLSIVLALALLTGKSPSHKLGLFLLVCYLGLMTAKLI